MIQSRLADLAFSALLAALGAYICYGALALGYMSNGSPGSGFFPFWIGLGICALAVLSISRSLRGVMPVADIPKAEALYVVIASALTLGFVVLAYLLGMLPAAFVLMIGIGLLFGARSRRFAFALVLLSAGMTLLIHLVFDRLLGVPALI